MIAETISLRVTVIGGQSRRGFPKPLLVRAGYDKHQ
jgi:hypothetical protein